MLNVYFISIFLFMNCSGMFSMWVLLELNTLLFSLMMLVYKEDASTIFYYYLIQTLGSFIFLLSLSNFNGSLFYLFFLVSMLLKSGMFPLSFWFFKIALKFGYFTFFLILTIQKLPPFMILFSNSSSISLMFFILNLIVGAIYLLNSDKFSNLLVSSSIYLTYWNYLIFLCSTYFFYFFYFFYSFTLYLGMKMLTYLNDFKFQGFSSWGTMVMVFFLMGLPPFSIFFMKFFFLSTLISSMNLIHLSLVWLFSFLCIMGYFNLFLKNLEGVNYFYSIPLLSVKISYLVFLFSSLVFLLGIIY